jgi:hypothetical protein
MEQSGLAMACLSRACHGVISGAVSLKSHSENLPSLHKGLHAQPAIAGCLFTSLCSAASKGQEGNRKAILTSSERSHQAAQQVVAGGAAGF